MSRAHHAARVAVVHSRPPQSCSLSSQPDGTRAEAFYFGFDPAAKCNGAQLLVRMARRGDIVPRGRTGRMQAGGLTGHGRPYIQISEEHEDLDGEENGCYGPQVGHILCPVAGVNSSPTHEGVLEDGDIGCVG